MTSTEPSTDPVIDLRGVGVALGGRPIVRDVDLQVHAGEVVALLGANGSGKSTLVKAMVGLHSLSAGQARLFGEPLAGFRQWQRLGYVPQRSPITQGVPSTVTEVIAAGRLSRRRPFVPSGRKDRAAMERALEAVGLSDRARHPVSTLSGGQQQRVLIARTLAGEPELLVLDEPNAGVDLVSQEAIAGTLAGLARNGATIVVVLHELGHLTDLIQRSVVLREGRVVYDGVPEDSPTEHGFHRDDHHHHEASSPQVLRPSVDAPLEGRS